MPEPDGLPYCVLNLASPVLDVLHGYLGLKVPSDPGGRDDGTEVADGERGVDAGAGAGRDA